VNRMSEEGPLVKYALGQEGTAYIERNLTHGMTLSRIAERRVRTSSGDAWSYLPPGMSRSTALSFRDPILPSGRNAGGYDLIEPVVAPSKPLVVEFVLQYLNGGGRRLFLVEDAVARPSDPAITSSRVPCFFVGDEVYEFISRPSATTAGISRAVDQAHSFPFVGVLTCTDFRPTRGSCLSAADLRAMAERMAAVVVGAYDGEGYVIWERT